MIKTHVAASGSFEGMNVPCPAEHQCRLASDEDHVYLANMEEVDEYNQLTLARKYGIDPADFPPRDQARLGELTAKSKRYYEEISGKSFVRPEHEDRVNHPDPLYRIKVAKNRVGLDYLANDPDWRVRAAVAKEHHSHATLVNDPVWQVRAAVASTGSRLEELSDDPAWGVRREVARQGYSGIALVSDPEEFVRLQTLISNRDFAPYFVNDSSVIVRKTLARIADERILERLMNDTSWEVRQEIAKRGYGLEKLARDEDYRVRVTVAETGEMSDTLSKDENPHVRAAVASSGKFLEELGQDNEPMVRLAAKKFKKAADTESVKASSGELPEGFIPLESLDPPAVNEGDLPEGFIPLESLDPPVVNEGDLPEGFIPLESLDPPAVNEGDLPEGFIPLDLEWDR